MKILQAKQYELDSIISENMKEIISKDMLIKCKIVALDIELAEFMNEIETFKFWKKNKGKEKAIEEFADCLHFILSIANELELECRMNYEAVYPSIDILNDYMYIKEKLSLFNSYKGKVELLIILNTILRIAKALRWEWEQIENAYLEKWKVNIERQRNNY